MMQNNIKIAITGGIGSGKTTVSDIIAEQGYRVISCDQIYKDLLMGENLKIKLADEFGNIFTVEGLLDRKKLAEIVFKDEDKLKKLNQITHPEIMAEALSRMSGQGLFFCEVPLLFENGYENLFDYVFVVLRNKSSRISAVAKRDNIIEQEIEKRINNQLNYDNFNFEKYYVIHNSSNIYNLRNQTLNAVKDLITKINQC